MQSSRIGKTVLCIDDEEGVRQVLHDSLEARGYTVLTASNGPDALKLTVENRPDAVVLDYVMGGMTGGEVAGQIKQTWPHMPIILFSGAFNILPRELACVDGFVQKGRGLHELVSMLERLMKESGECRIRRAPRFAAQLPFAVMVYRSGEPATLRGISTNVGEGGLAGNVEGNLVPGESVLIIIDDPRLPRPLEPRAQVRHRTGNIYGFEFVDITPGLQVNVRSFCKQIASS